MNAWQIFTLVYVASGFLIWIVMNAASRSRYPKLPSAHAIMFLLLVIAIWPLAVIDMARGKL